MYATARALAVASIVEADPTASAGEVRQALFLRFYGHEFDEQTRARILARIGQDAEREAEREPPSPPSRKVPVDWDALELALTFHGGEWESYLDVRTGEVRLHQSFGSGDDGELSDDDVEEGLGTGELIYIRPLESSVEYEWMAEFTGTIRDDRLHEQVTRALRGRRPFRRFKDALGDRREELERWFSFHDDQLRAAARDWVSEHGIEATTVQRVPGR
jgi:hypothetical protein